MLQTRQQPGRPGSNCVTHAISTSGWPRCRATLLALCLWGVVQVTAGPGDEGSADAVARGYLRASHADRGHVIDVLKAAFVQGMLTKAELDARVGQALASRTYAELAAVTADLPAGLAGLQPVRMPARGEVEQPVVQPGSVIRVATLRRGVAARPPRALASGC